MTGAIRSDLNQALSERVRFPARLAASVLVVIVALVVAPMTGVVRSANAQPRASTPCVAPAVAVVVDFSAWGEPPTRVCVPWSDSLTGYSLLHAAGFTTAGTVHDGPAFICRIGFPSVRGGTQFPTSGPPDNEACVLTPPASAYWSYWHTDPGGTTWSYGQLGATSYHPKPGSVDVWTFGMTDIGGTTGQPPFSPMSVLPAPAPVVTTPPATRPGQGPTGTTPGTPGPGGPSAVPGVVDGPTTRGERRSDGPPTTRPTGSPATPREEEGPTRSGSGRSGEKAESAKTTGFDPKRGEIRVRTVDAAPVAAPPAVGGSPAPAIFAVGLAVLLAVVGVWIVRLRAQQGDRAT